MRIRISSLWVPFIMGIGLFQAGNSSVFAQTLRVAAIRIEFQMDSLSATAGNGKFVLNSDFQVDCADTRFDPPPHNRAYFLDHLEAARRYWDKVSRGQVKLDVGNSQVFPLTSDGAYELPHDMLYYHPYTARYDTTAKLVEFVHDAMDAVGNEVDFSQFNTLIIFHAGLGGDFAFALDPTPGNLPSAYLNANDFQQNGYSPPIPDVLIIPESQNMLHFKETRDLFTDTDDPCFYQFGLNGTLALMLGFSLGLEPMYNTETGRSLIGKFGLMDQGAANMQGLVPAWPNPYSRYLQGWETFQDAFIGDTVSIAVDAPPIKVPIAPDEYYLIENRERNLSAPPSLPEWYINYDTASFDFGAGGVALEPDEYDAGYPGNGLIIWHIDENARVAGFNPNAGTTQWVDVVEADGAQDIGHPTRLLFKDFLEQGWWFDQWFAGNEGWFALNPNQRVYRDSSLRFGPDTHPATLTNTGRFSNITLEKISRSGSVMSFSVTSERLIDDRKISEVYGITPMTSPAVWGRLAGTDSIALFRMTATSLEPDENHIISLTQLRSGVSDSSLAYFYPYFVVHTATGNRFSDSRSDTSFSDLTDGNFTNATYFQGKFTYWLNGADSSRVMQIDTLTNHVYQIASHPDSIGALYESGSGSNFKLAPPGNFLPVYFQMGDEVNQSGQLKQVGNQLYLNNAEGSRLLSAAAPRYAIPVQADNDPAAEYILIDDHQIKVLNYNGTLVSDSPWPVDAWSGNPLVGYFKGTDYPEIFLRHAASYSIYDLHGKIVDTGALQYSDPVQPLQYFVTGTSNWQIIAGNNTYLKFSILGSSGKQPVWGTPESTWPYFRSVTGTTTPGTVTNSLMDPASVFNYPNPVTGNHTTFRAHLGVAKSWVVKIYALSGAPVAQVGSGIADQNSDNEMIWNTSSIGNGVYLANVKAVGVNGATASKIVKVMVIH